jgi:hypothetical protein
MTISDSGAVRSVSERFVKNMNENWVLPLRFWSHHAASLKIFRFGMAVISGLLKPEPVQLLLFALEQNRKILPSAIRAVFVRG